MGFQKIHQRCRKDGEDTLEWCRGGYAIRNWNGMNLYSTHEDLENGGMKWSIVDKNLKKQLGPNWDGETKDYESALGALREWVCQNLPQLRRRLGYWRAAELYGAIIINFGSNILFGKIDYRH